MKWPTGNQSVDITIRQKTDKAGKAKNGHNGNGHIVKKTFDFY
jgi:hypothetical protein